MNRPLIGLLITITTLLFASCNIIPEGDIGLSGYGEDVFVAGNYAYCAMTEGGLQIVDISDKQNPSLVAEDYTPGSAKGIFVDNDYAYVANDSNLIIYNVSTPSSPQIVETYSSRALSVWVEGDYCYIAGWTSGLKILNITDPSNPVEVGSLNMTYARSVWVEGNYAYIIDKDAGLMIVDITDKATPVLVGTFATADGWDAAVSGNYAYIADGDDGLIILDISDKTNPVLESTKGDLKVAYKIWVDQSTVYIVAGWGGGLWVFDVTDPSAPDQIDRVRNGGNGGVHIVNDYVYTIDSEEGLQIFSAR